MVEVEQRLCSRRVADLPVAVGRAAAAAGLAARIPRGGRIGITVGSRGIANLAAITRALVDQVNAAGGRPFVIPAMGSHGGAAAKGQTAVLASLGVTPHAVGAPIRASMAVSRIGETLAGTPVYVSQEALRADGVIVMNRVKQHTDFVGHYESGLVKMLAVGLGKREGAAAMHSRRCVGLREDVSEAARLILQRARVLAGIAILENGYNETADIAGIPPERILDEEPGLLNRARRMAGRILLPEIDLLLVDRIGKDISGIGMDTHVICRRMIWDEPEFRGARIHLIAALDLSEGSHGNALGIGLADLTTDRLLGKLDMAVLKSNVLHTGWLNRAKIPLAFPNDRALLAAALVALAHPAPDQVRIVRIPDTLHLRRIWVSEALLPAIEANPRLKAVGQLRPMRFDRAGNLVWPA